MRGVLPSFWSGEIHAAIRTMPVELLGQSVDELRALVTAMGEPAYRAKQLYHALYAERLRDVTAISNLPAALRERLAREAALTWPPITRRYHSADGTVRYVLSLAGQGFSPDNPPVEREGASAPEASAEATLRKSATIEAVFMPEQNRQTICISTQAGCAVDCHFCLTATLGLIRNLTAGEIIGQVLVALDDNRENLTPQTNVVLMGQGEPLLNYEPVMAALRILLDAEGVALSPKHVTLSTSGIVPGIERFGREPVRPKLAISLNASHDEQRERIMPINKKWPLAELMATCRAYPLRPWEKLTFEYVLLGGFNDAAEDARRVAKLVAGLRCKVNLIPWNPGELPYQPPDPARTEAFRTVLVGKGIPTFVRYSRGQDIMAACGQLALLESSRAGSTVQISL